MKRFVLFLMVALLSIGLVCATFAANPPLYAKGNVLVGANFNDGPGSSDMTLIIQLSGGGTIYVNEGYPVKYITDPDNKGITGWTKPSFDDKAWKDGVSGVGFADSDDNTTTATGLMSIWTRYRFDASNATSVAELTLLADYDDGYIVWLNGVEIARSAAVTTKGLKVGDEPAWDLSSAGLANRGSAELAAGKPNAARWSNAAIEKTVLKVDFTSAVSPMAKLTATWGSIKAIR